MNKCKNKPTHAKRLAQRLPKPVMHRNRPRNTVPVTLPIHTLEKFHRYTLNPMVMAVRTNEVIEQHELVKVDGEVLKVVSVSEISPGCVELRTVKFTRHNPPPIV